MPSVSIFDQRSKSRSFFQTARGVLSLFTSHFSPLKRFWNTVRLDRNRRDFFDLSQKGFFVHSFLEKKKENIWKVTKDRRNFASSIRTNDI